MNASIPPGGGLSLADVLASLDSEKIKEQIDQLEKTKGEVAAGLKESAERHKDIEDKVKWVDSERLKLKELRSAHDESGRKLFHLKNECEQKEKLASEMLLKAELELANAKAKAKLMIDDALAQKAKAESDAKQAELLLKTGSELKALYESKIVRLKEIIGEK